jgi:methylenetetrahydrofolate dehydrogenase (NADP+) / methenyltetrahydrofolate cyclohydrolase
MTSSSSIDYQAPNTMNQILTTPIDGKKYAHDLNQDLAKTIDQLAQTHHKKPCLAVVLIGDNPASHVYVSHKIKACQSVGIESIFIQLEADIAEDALLNQIHQLNDNPSVNGILVQLPLPAHLNAQAVIAAISAQKDVDGFHAENAGALSLGMPHHTYFQPCTPRGCMALLHHHQIDLKGQNAVVIGASNIVGKPMALLLQQAGATVTICNSKTKNLVEHTSRADIIVVAIGRPNFLTADMIKIGAVLIDVGINRLNNGQLVGDIDYQGVQGKASYATPVPGGVGPMTIAFLLVNTVRAFEMTHGVKA